MSPMLILHITISSISYILFGTAFAIACLYMYRNRKIKTKNITLDDRFPWSLDQLDRALFTTLIAGFVLMGVGLILGLAVHAAVYGNLRLVAPRLLFPLFIWMFYFLILLFRVLTGLRGTIPAHLTAYGILCVSLSFIYELNIAS